MGRGGTGVVAAKKTLHVDVAPPEDVQDGDDEFIVGRSYRSDWVSLAIPDTPSFKLDTYRSKKQAPYMRFIAKCSYHGSACCKRRNIDDDATGTVAFLCAWNALGEFTSPSEHAHRDFHVPDDLVKHWSWVLDGHCWPVLDLL